MEKIILDNMVTDNSDLYYQEPLRYECSNIDEAVERIENIAVNDCYMGGANALVMAENAMPEYYRRELRTAVINTYHHT